MSGKRSGGEPFWWYRNTKTAAARLVAASLTPIASIYGTIASRRMTREPAYVSKLPVICVGNLTAGGTGKTPIVRAICAHLKADGHIPVVLSRGYGGNTEGPRRVDVTRDTAETVGDEPLMIASSFPVVVARDRASGARFIEAAHVAFKATVIVMDDGLQNPALAKTLTVAVVDGVRGIGNGRVIPAGPLRASLTTQLKYTGVVVLVTPPNAPAVSERPAFLDRFNGDIVETHVAPGRETTWVGNAKLIAYAGIGAPERFFGLLENLGAGSPSVTYLPITTPLPNMTRATFWTAPQQPARSSSRRKKTRHACATALVFTATSPRQAACYRLRRCLMPGQKR